MKVGASTTSVAQRLRKHEPFAVEKDARWCSESFHLPPSTRKHGLARSLTAQIKSLGA